MKTILSLVTEETTLLVIRDALPFFKHLQAETLSHAAAMCQEHLPDIIIVQPDPLPYSFEEIFSSFSGGYMYRIPVIVISTPKPLSFAVDLSRLGAVYYLPLPLNRTELKQVVLGFTNKPPEDTVGETVSEIRSSLDRFVGCSKAVRQVKHLIQTFASHSEPVLITGETGTGKEIVSQLLHDLSRRNKPFSSINCSALPSQIVESTLFGHKRGSFTGAHRDHKGFFETSHGGTLLLDEIGDLDNQIQPKLLRVLETNRVIPVGETKSIPVKTRIISAANKNLKHLTTQGKFRLDLYFRINTLHIHIPPLNKRKEDIPLLVQHYLKDYPSINVSDEALYALQDYHWPGNVRELMNVLARMRILCGSHGISTVCITKQQILQAFDYYFDMQ